MGQLASKFQHARQPSPPEEGLVMKSVDCDWMKVENQKAHRTDEYENASIVLRRGQTFKIKATFQREYNETADKVFLEFSIGKNPEEVNDTKVRIALSETLNPAKWSMVLLDTDDTSITVEVNIPPNAIIGRYKTVVEFASKLESGEISKSRDKEPDVIVLFNPWCKDDRVFLENEEHREEYVLNDTGNVYRGSSWRISAKKWNFGQFEEHVLDTVLYLLDHDKRTTLSAKWLQKRRDPVWVCRAMSTMCSAANDGGVLEGNWSGKYDGGVSPLAWNGSVKILQQFHSTKKPVQFGQCWVFSGLMTTVLRSLGIPTRSVTNFSSAHDTEGSMTIDKYVDEEGEEIELGGDSVWNFHVWNESWMSRPDLPKGYDGWQAVDATPQEVSLGLFQTGPAPLNAIKKGEVYLGYETPFVFAEVNSDRVTWMVAADSDGNYEIKSIAKRYTSAVGRNISTKAVGKDEREDVTNQYKFPEGSDEERAAFRTAYGFGSQPEYQKGFLELQEEETKDGVDFEFSTNPADADLYNGDEFTVTITMKNQGAEERTVNLTASIHCTTYTGAKKGFVKRSKAQGIKLPANGSATHEMKVMYVDYSGKLVDHSAMRLVAVASVDETKKMFSEDYEFRLENREDCVTLVPDEGMKVGKRSNVTVHFTNPLPVKLTHVTVTLEGAGVSSPITRKITGVVLPKAKVETTFAVTPRRAGKYRMLIADVDSRQIQDLKKHVYLQVAEADPPPTPAPEPVPEPAATEKVEEKVEAPVENEKTEN